MTEKESGMNKLIELLNEYLKTFDTETNKTLKTFSFEEATKSFLARNGASYRQEQIISKRFKFIKRLVDNDKIDFSWEGELSSDLVALFERKVDNADGVIALLSISDIPIEDLISYLK